MTKDDNITVCLAFDISTKTGYSVFHQNKATQEITLKNYALERLQKDLKNYGEYPWNYLYAARDLSANLAKIVAEVNPDVIVIEETNKGRNRYSQKILEFLHNSLLISLDKYRKDTLTPAVFYLNSSEWRGRLGLKLSKEDKVNNKILKNAKDFSEASKTKLDKSKLGVRGKIGKKHIAIRWVNATYDLNLKMKDNDIADSIGVGTAFLMGARVCDGN
jgi:hypothetical protein